MPNHCENNLYITGPKPELQKFYNGIKEHDDELSILKTYFPCPDELKEAVANFEKNPEMISKYGYSSWYDWCNDNWGTKWGDYDLDINLYGNCIDGFFLSAWSPPINGFVNVSKQFPNLRFEISYSEPGMEFAGEAAMKNGKLLYNDEHEYVPEKEYEDCED